MLHTRILVAETADQAGKLAADEFEAVIAKKPAAVIGLATGSTPLPLYRELIAREKAGKIDFSCVRSANLDEYKGLAPDHEQSYRKFMQDNLLDHISIKPENTIVPLGLAEDIEKLIEERQAARKAKNFARADEIRDLLLEKGIVLKDTREGVKWSRA